jgi:hypothetical protein
MGNPRRASQLHLRHNERNNPTHKLFNFKHNSTALPFPTLPTAKTVQFHCPDRQIRLICIIVAAEELPWQEYSQLQCAT